MSTINRPGGFHVGSNVYFVLAGLCEMERDAWKEFDQIPSWKRKNVGVGHFRFDMCGCAHILCRSMFIIVYPYPMT